MTAVMGENIKTGYIGGKGEVIEEVHPVELYSRYFPNVQVDLVAFEGNYDIGLFVYNVEAPWEFLVVKPRKYRYEHVSTDETGKAVDMTVGDARESHVEVSRLTRYPEGVVNAAALVAPNYVQGNTINAEVLDDGVEEEYRLHDASTGAQLRVKDRELMEGEYETDTRSDEPLSLLVNLSELRIQAHEKFPEALIVSAGTPITGSPETSHINVEHPDYGQYISGIEYYLLAKGFGPHSQFLVEAMDQVAKAHGFENFKDMNKQTGERLLWPASARHVSLGLIHNQDFKADVDHAVNLSQILSSELASVVEMVAASGPFLWGVAPEMNFNGVKSMSRDFRHVFRKMMSTTSYPSFPVRSPEQLAADTAFNIANTDRLDRAHLTNVSEDGFENPTEHGMNRARVTLNQKKEGRIEYTGASNSYMRAGVISACVLNYLSSIALVASAKGMNVFDFIEQETGIPANDLWGFNGATEETVTEYMFKGVSSVRLEVLLNKLTHIFQTIEIPGNAIQKDIALTAFKNLKRRSKTLQELAVTGKGSLGETLLNYSNKSGLEVAKLVHAFEYCEAKFVNLIKNKESLLAKYLKGELGFYFDESWANNPLALEKMLPRIIYNQVEA